MRILKKMAALVLILTLLSPLILIPEEAVAATALNTITREPVFRSSSPVSPPTAATAIPGGGTKHTPAFINPPSLGGNYTAWSYAATAVLNSTSAKLFDGRLFDNTHMTGFDKSGNRSSLAAYLMNVANGGPYDSVFGTAQRTPVRGVVYIPDPAGRRDWNFIYNVQNAVLDNGAVAASLFFDINKMNEDIDTRDSKDDLYHNMSSGTINHTVVIVGWDDSKIGTYTSINVRKDPVETFTPNPGAFLVYDDNNQWGEYWVSYETLLSGAYYIEGFYNNNGASGSHFQAVTTRNYTADMMNKDKSKTNPKNPLAYTYQYDTGALAEVTSTGSATQIEFANVFDVKEGALALQAISVFLTGENNFVNIYLIDDYEEEADLSNVSKRIPLVSNIHKSLPGYYTIPVNPAQLANESAIITGKKFAVVAEISHTPITGSGVPTASATASNSYMSRGGVWAKTKATTAVCLKAHAEKDIDVNLKRDGTGVSLPQSKDTDDNDEFITVADLKSKIGSTDSSLDAGATSSGHMLLSVAPNTSHSIGPTLKPANANNVLNSKTTWRAYMEYYERYETKGEDEEGYLKASLVNGKWVADAPVGPEWLVWDSTWGMFVPQRYIDNTLHKPSNLKHTMDEDGKTQLVTDYADPAILLSNPTTGATTLRVSKETDHYGSHILLEAKVTATDDRNNDGTPNVNSQPADLYEEFGYTVVHIKADAVAEVRVDKSTLTMRAGATTTLKATQWDAEGVASKAPRKLTWHVAQEYSYDSANDLNVYTDYGKTYDPRDPYAEGGPIATVDENGKVTALRNGTCFVYARLADGTIASKPCRITISKAAPTGISINKKKMTMSAGTSLTLTATVKPSSASNKGVNWSTKDQKPLNSSDTEVLRIDSITGIIEAKNPGTAVVIATSREGSYKAECVMTVTAGPSATVKMGKSASYSILGAASKATIEWTLTDLDGTTRIPQSTPDPSDPGKTLPVNTNFTGGKSGTSKYKVSAAQEGPAILTGTVYASYFNGTATEDVKLREQSWTLEAVVPISKMAFRDKAKDDDIVKKLILCVGPNGADAQTIDLWVDVIKPADGATILDFEWSVKKNKNGDSAKVEMKDPTKSGEVTITALKPGTAKITGINYNGKKKINITVKVLQYPSSAQIKPKSASLTLNVGKTTSVKAKVEGKNVSKELTYSLPADAEDILTLDENKKKVTAVGVGTTTLTITSVGDNGKIIASKTVKITVQEKPGRK